MTRTIESPTVEVTWVHRYEYQSRNADGTWTEPEIRYHNLTESESQARRRHAECAPYETVFDREFEGIFGYRWSNDVLVKRTVIALTIEEESQEEPAELYARVPLPHELAEGEPEPPHATTSEGIAHELEREAFISWLEELGAVREAAVLAVDSYATVARNASREFEYGREVTSTGSARIEVWNTRENAAHWARVYGGKVYRRVKAAPAGDWEEVKL
jgi:hypothetical protein